MLSLLLCALLLLMIFVWHRSSRSITVHVPPDLSNAVSMPAGSVPAPNVYAFALFAFQKLNFWQRDGDADYARLIDENRCFHTANFKRWLENNFKEKRARGELGRSRGLFPRNGFSADRVRRIGDDTWLVQLDMNLREWVKDRLVKDTAVRYQLRVARFDISRECNPWGLALDGHEQAPQRIDAR